MEAVGKIWEKIKPHYIWYALGLVVVLYLGSFLLSHFTVLVFLPGAMSQLAATVIAGGIFASLLKSYQFSNLFKEELEKLFATEQFVQRMKSIAQHGEHGDLTLRNAFERVAAQTSPELARAVPESFDRLMAVSSEYSLRNYKRYIKITAYAKSAKMITIEDEVEYELDVYADTDYKSSAGGAAFADKPNIKAYTLTERGGGTTDVRQEISFDVNKMGVQIPIKKGKMYTLHRVVEMKFQLYKDPNIHQQFQRFCSGLQIEIENQVSTQISYTLDWVNFAVDPEAAPRTEAGRTVCRYQNHGLTFPYQGFILTMSPNN